MLQRLFLIRKSVIYGIVTLLLLFSETTAFIALPSSAAQALSGTSFNAGDIIDNSVFTDSSTMSASDIQNFLNKQVPDCDTNGTQLSTHSNGSGGYYTHAQWGAVYDSANNTTIAAAPYVCLENYLENPSNGQNNLQNPTANIPGAESAAQIIYNASQQYQINPEVILTTLQKEQGLVTDNWPWTNEYTEAMGFNCPDSSGCSGYADFYQQVNSAAAQYRNYLNNPNDFDYVVGDNTILYSPANCGSSTVDIKSLATAALYDYTPYQPDSTVLTDTNPTGSPNGPGSASNDSCSDPTYGNRNFWWYFNTWFGASISSGLPGCAPATDTSLTCVWEMSNPINFDQFLTSSISTRDGLFTTQNYQYTGIDFYGNTVEEPGNIPVYRASINGGGSFLTTSTTEYNSLIAGGYTGNGIDFYADPSTADNDGFPVYRLYNSSTGQHYWTGDATEQQTLINDGWTSEGIAFNSIDPIRQETPPPAGDQLVYRFYIPQNYGHFWTTDLAERDSMITAGYDYEGVAWYSSSNTSDTPVYRLYSPSINQHFYTTSVNEMDTLIASGGWSSEGVDQYVTTTPNSVPIYRLYSPSLGVHMFTESPAERAQLLSSGGWNDEGIAWYQP